jgi:hypothetical protein
LEVTESRSSNWRELDNLVEGLVQIVVEQGLLGSANFTFTNHSTAEAAFWKCTSDLKNRSFELVLQLKELELEYDIQLHFNHASGKQTIAKGTDGLFRANHGKGVMTGESIQS